jgi:phage terminase large subunit-like protein
MKNPKLVIIIVGVIILLIAAVVVAVFVLRNDEPDTPDLLNEPPPVTDETITRAQWIQRLTDTMGYNKENNADAYFMDIQAGHATYNSVQIAVAYNLVAPADRFNPDSLATREFVTTTATNAIGFLETPDSSFFFDSPDGGFDPNEYVTVTESEELLRKIRDIVSITIDPNHVDTVTYHAGVIDLLHAADTVTFNDPAAMTVIITGDNAIGLTVGTVYILPPSREYPYGLARKVRSIRQEGDTYIIENEEPAIEEVFSEIDVQGVYYPDYDNAVWMDGVTDGSLYSSNTPSSEFSVQALSNVAQSLSSSDIVRTFRIGDDVEATLTIHELKATAYVRSFLFIPISAGVRVEASYSLSLSVQLDNLAEEFKIGEIPIPLGPTGISVRVRVSLSLNGDLTFTLVNSMQAEIWLNILNTGTATNGKINNHDLNFDITASVEAGPVLGVSLNILGIDLAEISAFIGIGAKATITSGACIDLTIYMPFYIRPALLPQLRDIIDLSFKIDIWTADNSLVRFPLHIENGEIVDLCTRMGGADPPEDDLPPPETVDYITIRGVQYSTALTELILISQGLSDSDIEPLRHMTNLIVLHLSDNRISNIGVLAGLANLDWLTLCFNQIHDVSPLAELTNLTWLTLEWNPINDISALTGLINLEYLTLYNTLLSYEQMEEFWEILPNTAPQSG